MRQIERRIKRFVGKRPGAISTDIIEYLGLDPQTVKRTLQSMKEKGLIVGKLPNEQQE